MYTTPTWNEPVELKLQCGLTRTFKEACDALYFLEEEWPVRHGTAYQRARRWCGSALETDRTAGIARKAFIGAARKAGLLDDGASPESGSGRGMKARA